MLERRMKRNTISRIKIPAGPLGKQAEREIYLLLLSLSKLLLKYNRI
jgi:hypothetical protein